MSVMPNKWSKILPDSPKTITATTLQDHMKLFVAVKGLSLQDSYCMCHWAKVILNVMLLHEFSSFVVKLGSNLLQNILLWHAQH